MKLFEHAGFWGGRPAALIAVALMVSAARADDPYIQSDGTQYIAEFSRECQNVQEAAELRDIFIEKLDGMGILLHEDALKTELILNQLK